MVKLLLILNFIAMPIYELPKLPYELDALEPQISKETMEYHYLKHHQAYVTNLNNLIEGTKYEKMPLEEIIKNSDGPLFNNAAQTWNHTNFFLALSANPKARPDGELAKAIERDFGSFDKCKEEMTKAAQGLFGSGWAWLAADSEGKLSVMPMSNGQNPMIKNLTPLLCIDVWEHAYYIDYRNRRPDYITALWDKIDWAVIEKRYSDR
ncbi:superoxide dismutase [Holotrichia oblita]|uniref:Superoxide dismutase n=1 Tax=Holotrichia oblita TaxID=644536 RepID=A0ACB9TR37_HOLOL|nr:superoxide dismutase [Holotrichia oblita]